MAFSARSLLLNGFCRAGVFSSAARMSSEAYSHAEKIVSASISSVCPAELVSKALSYEPSTQTLSVAGHSYLIDRNVKVVAFGKAVLGMVAALERLIGGDITEGVASVPVGAVGMAEKFYPHHLPPPHSKIKIYEGAAGNLPDLSSQTAAQEVLSVARRCGKEDVLVALVSGGGSALLSCPVEGITLQEKREVIESLSKGGADICELNTLRMAISQTKGGKLAEAAKPAKVLGLILSDVIGDPVEKIASGPTVSQPVPTTAALEIMDKYGLLETPRHSAVSSYLKSVSPVGESAASQEDCLNVVIGSNKTATAAAKETAITLGYTTFVWSRHLQGEAAFLGELYASFAHYTILRQQGSELKAAREELCGHLSQLAQASPQLSTDVSNLMRMMEVVEGDRQPFCLIGAGEPTVKVTGGGKGGRNQELALSYALALHHRMFRGVASHGSSTAMSQDCVFACVGTDGQDGPHGDAAGAMVDPHTLQQALDQGLQPDHSLQDNDSNTFFSKLNSGKNLVKTGLTGTNVMDIHILLVR